MEVLKGIIVLFFGGPVLFAGAFCIFFLPAMFFFYCYMFLKFLFARLMRMPDWS